MVTAGSRATQEHLNRLLADHREWLSSGAGHSADLSGWNLSGLDFGDADLRDAILAGADLRGATLDQVRGLQAAQLAGAELSRARLPNGLEFHAVRNVDELGQSCMRLFTGLLLACAYVLFTAAVTPDSALLGNTVSAKLPILAVELPILGFFKAIVPTLLFFYLALHFHLQRLWEETALLPATFQDGATWERRVRPSLFTSVSSAARTDLGPRLERWVLVLATWWSVPLVLLAIWARCLPRRDVAVTAAQMLAIALSVYVAKIFVDLNGWTLARGRIPWRAWRAPAQAIAAVAALGLLSYGSLKGDRVDPFLGKFCEEQATLRSWYDPSDWVPRLLDAWAWGNSPTLGGSVFDNADLRKLDLDCVDFSASDLRRTTLSQVYLRGSDLSFARFEDSSLEEADLETAVLDRAVFVRTSLRDARLIEASLWGAHLENADLSVADLTEAQLPYANLSGARLVDAHLTGANLTGATLTGADLTGAYLKGAVIEGAVFTNAIMLDLHLASCALVSAAQAGGAKKVSAHGGCSDVH